VEFLRRGPLIVLLGIFFAVSLFGGYQAVAYDGQVAAPSGCPACPDPCAYTIFPANEYFSHGGGTGNVSVTTKIGCSWTAISYESWINITSGSSGSGSGTVYYSVDANSGTTSRTGTIRIAGKTFTVNQGGRPCTYSISPLSENFSYSGGTGNVSVTTQSGCYWTAVSHESWISITSGSSGTGSGTVYYSVDANSGTTSRTGTMNIAGATFTVNQDGRSCTYCIGPNPVPDTGTAFFYSLPVGTSTAKLMVLSATSGRLLFETSIDVDQTRFPATGTWDPVDNDGVRLANGPYLYVLIANGQLISQGKMVIQR